MTSPSTCGSGFSLRDLIALAAAGDEAAFMEFYDRTCDWLFSTVLARLAGDWVAASETTERIYLSAWIEAPRMQDSGVSVMDWWQGLVAEAVGSDGRGDAA